MTTACRFSAGCCCFKNIFSLFFHIVSFFPLLFFVVFSLLCRGSGAAFFRRQGKTGFCRVGFLLCLYCFRLILLSFFLSLSLPLSLCRFPFVVPGFWSGVFPSAGEDRLLPCWFFIVFVLFPIDFCCLFFFLFCCFFFVFTWNVEINSKRNCEEREKVNF